MSGNQLSGLLEVADVRKSDHPFERGRPEEDRERSCRVCDEALSRLRERQPLTSLLQFWHNVHIKYFK